MFHKLVLLSTQYSSDSERDVLLNISFYIRDRSLIKGLGGFNTGGGAGAAQLFSLRKKGKGVTKGFDVV